MPKDDLRDKLDGKELDLTLSNLTTVPVKELAAIPKATHLDLSCNLLATLPDQFCTLRHLVKIDLSKNVLIELPINFGDLENLQHLDLLGNKLTLLPISFCHLIKLRWLDLKDNPLEYGLKTSAGDCLDEAQCRLCAKQVVTYMTAIDTELEKKRQLKVEAERKRLAKKAAHEEKAKQKVKEKKRLEKERRKKEYELQRNLEREAEEANKEKEQEKKRESSREKPVVNGPRVKQVTPVKKESTGLGVCGFLMVFVIGLMAIAVGLYYYCSINNQIPTCHQAMDVFHNFLQQTRQKTDTFIKYVNEKYTEIIK